jgi:hypothetical protein
MSDRILNSIFFTDLYEGRLASLTKIIRDDIDLDLQIRKGYINVYFKGNSLLKLEKTRSGYASEIHPKFLGNFAPFDFESDHEVERFAASIPSLKSNINVFGSSSLELEFEQLLIRANNREKRNNTEYFFVDRQYVSGKERFDLMGFYWARSNRGQNRKVQPCMVEVKYGLNSDISQLAAQIDRYHFHIQERAGFIVDELEANFEQKRDLGMYTLTKEQESAMKDLEFCRNPKDFLYVLALIDFNPHSKLFSPETFLGKVYRDQIRIFSCGLAMWDQVAGYNYSAGVCDL